MLEEHAVTEFRARGFVVLRDYFDPAPLAREVDEALDAGFEAAQPRNVGSAGNEFRYLPMMCKRTPLSLMLLEALAEPASKLLGREVLPVRAKGTCYFGGTPWHRDSEVEVPSVGLLAYLEPLEKHAGALRVLPRSHRATLAAPPSGLPGDSSASGAAIDTVPGDLIALDEHLWHSSAGGQIRRQWRVDFVAAPANAKERALVGEYFDSIFQPGWDGGYDVDLYPSYDAEWQASPRPWVEPLRQLGAYARAHAEEAAVRSARPG